MSKTLNRDIPPLPVRIGTGYDVHRLVEGRDLVLGGVKIPFAKGSLGHSDGDALTHAIADALLGALALGDIGQHFPDTDPNFKGSYSIDLLAQVVDLVHEQHYVVSNIDATVILEEPKLRTYLPEMCQNLARALQVELNQVSVKATTTEKLGITGRGEAVAAQALCLVTHKQ